jgi:TetR/AcrR family transcriptional repressor of nem operon
MRVSKEQAAEHHRAIIEAAAIFFREEGFDGVNVSDIMKKAGLTHGAFYGHFSSKAALAVAACRYAFDERLAGWTDDVSLTDYLDRYVSTLHRDRRGRGCPMAAFASDIDRQHEAVQKEYETGVSRYRERIASWLPTSGHKWSRAILRLTPSLHSWLGALFWQGQLFQIVRCRPAFWLNPDP